MGHRYDLEVELEEIKVTLEDHQDYIVELEKLLDVKVGVGAWSVFDIRENV